MWTSQSFSTCNLLKLPQSDTDDTHFGCRAGGETVARSELRPLALADGVDEVDPLSLRAVDSMGGGRGISIASRERRADTGPRESRDLPFVSWMQR